MQFGICPLSVITPLSWELLRVYTATGGLSRIRSPGEYYSLPAVFVDACKIIEEELAKIKKAREEIEKNGSSKRQS